MPVADCRLNVNHQHSHGQHQRTGVASTMGGGGASRGGTMGGASGAGAGSSGFIADGVGGMMVMGVVGTCDTRQNDSQQLYLTDAPSADADDPDPDVIPNQYGE